MNKERLIAQLKRERRAHILSNVALFLVLTAIPAGVHSCGIWFSPDPVSGFDLFLFFYAIIAFAIGIVMKIAAIFELSDDGSSEWIYDNYVPPAG